MYAIKTEQYSVAETGGGGGDAGGTAARSVMMIPLASLGLVCCTIQWCAILYSTALQLAILDWIDQLT